MKEVGEIAAGLFHDIYHPLSMIGADLNSLKKETEDKRTLNFIEEGRDPLKMIESAVSLVRHIRLDSENVGKWLTPISVKLPVPAAKGLYRRSTGDKALNIYYDDGLIPLVKIRSNPEILAEAFFNIIKNAKESHSTKRADFCQSFFA